MKTDKHWVIIGSICGLTCLLLIAFLYFKFSQKGSLEEQKADTVPQLNYYQMPNEITAIFLHEISQEDSMNRSWPAVRIMRRVGDSTPEILATVGKPGEYPSQMRVTPDHKYLLISLENKLVRLNLSTKEIIDFFSSPGIIHDFIFSPDGNRVLVLDNSESNMHIMDIETSVGKYVGRKAPMDSLLSWRDDDMVIGFASKGEGGWSVNYNLKTGLPEQGSNGVYGGLSKDGYFQAVPIDMKETDKLVPSCYSMGGYSAAYTSIIDLKTDREVERFGDENHATMVVAFSPDNREILYYQEGLAVDQSDCNEQELEKKRTYYKTDINGKVANQPVMVEDPLSLLTGWGVNHFGVKEDYKFNDPEGNSFSIVYGTFVIAQSKSFIRLIDAWYSEDGDIANLNSPRIPSLPGWKVYESRKWDYYINYPLGSAIRDQVDLVDFLPVTGGFVTVDNGCYTTFEMSTATSKDIIFKGYQAKETSLRFVKDISPTEDLYAISIGFEKDGLCRSVIINFTNSSQLPQLRRIAESIEFTGR